MHCFLGVALVLECLVKESRRRQKTTYLVALEELLCQIWRFSCVSLRPTNQFTWSNLNWWQGRGEKEMLTENSVCIMSNTGRNWISAKVSIQYSQWYKLFQRLEVANLIRSRSTPFAQVPYISIQNSVTHTFAQLIKLKMFKCNWTQKSLVFLLCRCRKTRTADWARMPCDTSQWCSGLQGLPPARIMAHPNTNKSFILCLWGGMPIKLQISLVS